MLKKRPSTLTSVGLSVVYPEAMENDNSIKV